MADRSAYYAEWKAKKLAEDPDYFKRIGRKHRAKRLAEDPDGYRKECCEQVNARSAQRRKDNTEKYMEMDRIHNERHKEKKREWTRNNSEARRAIDARYREKNPQMYSERRAAKIHRTPAWANREAIHFFYECRPAGCHVDHVIPLQGQTISGLHVETNLQWLPARVNQRKSNSFRSN